MNLTISTQENWKTSNGVDFDPAGNPAPSVVLPVGIYEAKKTMFGWYLHKIADKYEFPYKVYNYEGDFINRVNVAFKNTTKNLGVLLNGFKGAGKSVTAKQICNSMNLPVIIITDYVPGIVQFVSSIQDTIVVFMDEYEKIFAANNESSKEILTMMDGANDVYGRKLFLLTTNSLKINENMISRPGRIRYLKTYSHLDPRIVLEIIEDFLEDKSKRLEVINFIKRLKIISIDLVKAIIHEVNIFNEIPESFKDIFNAELSKVTYKLTAPMFNVNNGEFTNIITVEYFDDSFSPSNFSYEGNSVYVNGNQYIGEVEKLFMFDDDRSVLIKLSTNHKAHKVVKDWTKRALYDINNKDSSFRPYNTIKEIINLDDHLSDDLRKIYFPNIGEETVIPNSEFSNQLIDLMIKQHQLNDYMILSYEEVAGSNVVWRNYEYGSQTSSSGELEELENTSKQLINASYEASESVGEF